MRLIKSFGYAWQGIKHCCLSEKNFRIQLIIATATSFLGIICEISSAEWLSILICSALVLGLEMVNTTIEKLSNIVTESIHPQIKLIKDIAAGAVCMVSILSFIIGAIIFFPKFQSLINYK